ncbi:MAG: hypothetical protein MH204_02185, partial [Fimbriimonadaceae bacterium]|nr:hypothetical protein [Fimbriimonadaceae bacterium]
DKIWVVFAGAVFGIILLRFAAGLFLGLLEKYPALDHVAYLLVGWVGIKLCTMAGHNFVENWARTHTEPLWFRIPEMDHNLFWAVMGAIIVLGTIYAVSRRPPEPAFEAAGASGTPSAPDFSPDPGSGQASSEPSE